MAEDHGLTVVEQEFGGDTDLPSNIDDQNVHETLPDPPRNHSGWTETSFCLIIAEINKMWVPIARSTNDSPDGSQAETMLKQLKNTLHERYLQYADLDIPIQRQGVRVAQVLVTKAEVHIRQKVLQLQATTTNTSSSTTDTDTQDLLGMAVNALELGLDMHTDQMLRGFRWLTSTYTQFHLLTYILWHLCVYPTGPHVDRAWRGVDRHFDLAENDPSWPDPGPKWPMIAQMRAKALRIRQVQFSAIERGGQVVPVSGGPGTGTGTGVGVGVGGMVDEGVVQGNQNNEALLDMGNWDLNWLEFPDWSYLAQSIAIMGQ